MPTHEPMSFGVQRSRLPLRPAMLARHSLRLLVRMIHSPVDAKNAADITLILEIDSVSLCVFSHSMSASHSSHFRYVSFVSCFITIMLPCFPNKLWQQASLIRMLYSHLSLGSYKSAGDVFVKHVYFGLCDSMRWHGLTVVGICTAHIVCLRVDCSGWFKLWVGYCTLRVAWQTHEKCQEKTEADGG
jgi:hypothetical protein